MSDMTHFITRKTISNLLGIAVIGAFVFIGLSAQASAQSKDPADQGGVLAGQSYGIQTPQGTNVMWFQARGFCNGIAGSSRGRATPYTCQYEASQIGDDRISLTVRSTLDGYRTASTETLRIMPDGNLFNETAQTTAFRLRPDGLPCTDAQGRR
tara:strand:+ start:1219 stop:1680 length:462 start_codon:yes stop_codon:yes gene_type:complete